METMSSFLLLRHFELVSGRARLGREKRSPHTGQLLVRCFKPYASGVGTGFGSRLLGFQSDLGFRVSDLSRVSGFRLISGFGLQTNLGFRVRDRDGSRVGVLALEALFGSKIHISGDSVGWKWFRGFEISDFGFQVPDFGFRVSGFRPRWKPC